jgi:hypothetical protein
MRKLFVSAILFLACTTAMSQTFMHGVGLSILGGYTDAGDFTIAGGYTYSPRINFVETEKLSVSAGIPLSMGVTSTSSFEYDSYSGYTNEYSIDFVANENRQKFGYFVGGGYGFHHGSFYGFYPDELDPTYERLGARNLNVHGPAANAGLRFGVGKKHKNIELRFSFMKGINESKPNIFGIAGLFNF